MTYRDREQLKREANEVLSDAASTLEQKKAAALKIIRAHYERSIQAWGPCRAIPHGTLTEYAQSWLSANGNRHDIAPQEVMAALREEFPVPAQVMISPGSSYWGSV